MNREATFLLKRLIEQKMIGYADVESIRNSSPFELDYAIIGFLILEGVVSMEEIIRIRALNFNAEFVNFDQLVIKSDAIALIDRDYAIKHKVVPLMLVPQSEGRERTL